MKTLIIIALTFAGITAATPEAQARDRYGKSYGYSRSSYGHSYYRSGCAPRAYYSRSYYSSGPRYYYRPARSYYYADRCEPVRGYGFRPPLISFHFGF